MQILVATDDGIRRVTPGQTPEVLGPAGLTCRSVGVVDGVYYAGGLGGGLWRSADEGRTWQQTDCPSKEVWDVVEGPGKSVWTTGRPVEIYRSADGVGGWQGLNLMSAPDSAGWLLPGQAGPRVMTLCFDQVAERVIYAAVEVGGVAVSEDNGATWQTVVPGDAPDLHWLAPHPTEAGVVFCTTGFTRIGGPDGYTLIPRAGTYRSADFGRTWEWAWTPELPQYTRMIRFDPRSPHPLFVVATPRNRMTIQSEGGAQSGVLMTLDQGKTWTDLGGPDGPPAPALFHSLVPDPERAGCVILSNEIGEIWRLDAEARRWELLAQGLTPAPDIAVA